MRASSILFPMVVGLSVALSFLTFTPVRAEIIPPEDVPFGKTYGEWGGEWWNWAVHEPDATNPISDDTGEDGDLNQSGPVWFLAGNWGSPPATVRTELEVPEGKALFFPVVTGAFWTPEDGATEAEVRALANGAVDNVSVLWASVDGAQLPVVTLRDESPPGGFVLNVPAGSILDEWGAAAVGDHDPTVADGFWVMLEPLPLGEHVVHFKGAIGDPFAPDFFLDVKYDPLTVVPEPSTLILLTMGVVGLAGYAWYRRKR